MYRDGLRRLCFFMDLLPGSSGAEDDKKYDGKDEELICILDHSRYRRVLRMHCMDSLTWQAIAERYTKSRRGDTSAAKFIKEINREGASPDDTGISICISSAM